MAKKASAKKATAASVVSWTDDPVGGQLVGAPTPDLAAGLFPMRIEGTGPAPKVYDSRTAAFRYWNTATTLKRAKDFWSRSCPLEWCSSSLVATVAGVCRAGHAATAGSVTMGSSLSGAMVSSVM